MEYTITNIIDIIELSEKYEKGRKRAREKTKYNFDVDQLKYCVEPLKKLNDLIGMDDIKKNIVDQILFYAQGLNTGEELMNVCITGSPGVGKTTLINILAEIYCSLGFLKKGTVKFASRDTLIAGYLGQTAIKTKKFLKESIGCCVVIDEIYSLGVSKDDHDSFAKECCDCINQYLSETPDNFLMIVAGYEVEVENCFFSMNQGLRRRFPWKYSLPDYTTGNLKDIFLYQVHKSGWDFEKNMDFSSLESMFSQKDYFKDNGGSCLQLFDKAKICHSRRVFGKRKNAKKYINLSDITQGFQLLKKQIDGVKKLDTIPFGMYI